ncbi:MAG TPA: hypothetical protein VFK07_03320 [Candidatus Paceibacterota bacterium]|nr:hypothetical protein [Candidatus Paceibacterota bacterium]
MSDKHTRAVREIAKFLSGLIAADILMGIWLKSGGYTGWLLGVPLTPSFVDAWLTFDIALLIFLISYGWHISVSVSTSRRIIFVTAGVLLAIVAVLHFLRILYSVPVIFGQVSIPLWLSIIGVIIPGFLAYASFRLASK